MSGCQKFRSTRSTTLDFVRPTRSDRRPLTASGLAARAGRALRRRVLNLRRNVRSASDADGLIAAENAGVALKKHRYEEYGPTRRPARCAHVQDCDPPLRVMMLPQRRHPHRPKRGEQPFHCPSRSLPIATPLGRRRRVGATPQKRYSGGDGPSGADRARPRQAVGRRRRSRAPRGPRSEMAGRRRADRTAGAGCPLFLVQPGDLGADARDEPREPARGVARPAPTTLRGAGVFRHRARGRRARHGRQDQAGRRRHRVRAGVARGRRSRAARGRGSFPSTRGGEPAARSRRDSIRTFATTWATRCGCTAMAARAGSNPETTRTLLARFF